MAIGPHTSMYCDCQKDLIQFFDQDGGTAICNNICVLIHLSRLIIIQVSEGSLLILPRCIAA